MAMYLYVVKLSTCSYNYNEAFAIQFKSSYITPIASRISYSIASCCTSHVTFIYSQCHIYVI